MAKCFSFVSLLLSSIAIAHIPYIRIMFHYINNNKIIIIIIYVQYF